MRGVQLETDIFPRQGRRVEGKSPGACFLIGILRFSGKVIYSLPITLDDEVEEQGEQEYLEMRSMIALVELKKFSLSLSLRLIAINKN